MTRREEIYEASCECYNDYIDVVNVNADAAQDAFIKGAEWADKTMIEKACDWFQCMALDYMQGDITDVKWASMFADLRNYIENGDN